MSKFQEYIPIYEGDRYCLMCGQSCPVRRVTGSEATSPHGWALLVASVERGMLKWDANAVDVLYRCADCGNCQGNCATDRPLPYAIQAARAEVVRLGNAPASVSALDAKLRAWNSPYGEVTKEKEDAGETASTALFVGDAAYFLQPQVVDAAGKLLDAVGISYSAPRAGSSSGYLPYTLGLWDTARALADATAHELERGGAERVITLSPQDAHTLLHVYPELGVAVPEGLQVTTLADVLAEAGDALGISTRPRADYTFHDAAQALRLKEHASNTRVLAKRVMGTEPREMLYRENLATPVGTCGGLEFTQPALAAKLAQTRIAEARATGANIILTDDPLDTATLQQYADGMIVLNLYQVLADQIEQA